MNRRIRKKKQKLAAMHASKWKYAKLGRKLAHAVSIETRHCVWGLIPHKEHYARFLRKRRKCGKLESKVTRRALEKSCVMILNQEERRRKEAKEKLFLKEGNCNFEGNPLPDGYIIGRIHNGQRTVSAALKIPMLPAET